MNLLDAFKQYIKDAMPGGALNPEVSTQGVLDTAALATAPVPFLGDAIGLAADVKRLKDNPSERTPANFGLAALGALPFVPPLGMVRPKHVDDLANAIREKSKAPLETPPLPSRLWDAIQESRARNNQTPLVENVPYITPETIDKFGWKRGGKDGKAPETVADMANSVLYARKSKAAASGKRHGEATAIINAGEQTSNIGFIVPDQVGRPVINTVYETQTPKLANKLGVVKSTGGTRLPTSISQSESAGSEAFRLSDDASSLSQFMESIKPPQADALETARKNAVTMLGLPPNNTPMDRAKALGFDTEAFHSTGNDFRSFQVNPYRGAVSVAATPSGAVSGAKAGQADITGSGATSVMPLLMRSEGVQGLRLPADQEKFLGSLPKVAIESQVDDLMKSAPKGSYWGNFFNEVEGADGSFYYVRKEAPKVSFQDVQKTKRGADGAALPNWGDERWSANRQKEIGGKGWLQADEAGISASIVDPSILRSRFAAFDPARINENDLLGRADLGLLGLLAGGAAGAAYLTSDKNR